MTHPLGRVHIPDARDAQYPASLHLEAVAAPQVPISKSWYGPTLRLDQGNVGACVGFAAENWLGATPIRSSVSNAKALSLYQACKQIDGYAGEGTSDRYSAKVLVSQGKIDRYLWAMGESDFLQWLSYVGPIMVGTDWTNDMFSPILKTFDTQGQEAKIGVARFMLELTGSIAGGHEYLIRRLDYPRRMALIRNSWGDSWAQRGEAWISLTDLFSLVFGGTGDALCAVQRA